LPAQGPRRSGPLWEPLCYAQIGVLTVATVVTLLLVPVLYAAFVLDLKLARWERRESHLLTPGGGVSPDGSFRRAPQWDG
jgi:hypothetical protein